MVYEGGKQEELESFSDADCASCRDSRKSVSGILIEHCGGPIVWKSTKQPTVAEFIACSYVSRVDLGKKFHSRNI